MRHNEIGEDDVKRVFPGLNEANSFISVTGSGDDEILGFEVLTQCQPKVIVVVDDQDARFARNHFPDIQHVGPIGIFLENFRFES